MDKKILERCALDAFLNSDRKLKAYVIHEYERPDFVLEMKSGYRIGIEHFRSDTILNEYSDSESMKLDNKRKAMFKKHNTTLLNERFDADSAANDVEENINASLAAVLDFDYNKFIARLQKVFNDHSDKVDDYKKKCDEIWFLIDIGIENEHFIGFLENGGKSTINSLPVTLDMIDLFNKKKSVERVIIVSRCLGLGPHKFVYDSKKKYGYRFKSFVYVRPPARIKLDVKDRGMRV